MISATIAIPTYNRAELLKEAIISSLGQTFNNFELLILDNNSSDNTKDVVESFTDNRIRYHRNEQNIGMMNNWNKAVELARGDYLIILGDDDKLYPQFLERSLNVHKIYPRLGFTFSHCNKVDEKGKFLKRWGYQFTPSGFLKGSNYLYYSIKYDCCLTNSSTVFLNTKVFKKVGLFQDVYGANTFDFNMWIRIAGKYDVYFINEVLVDYQIHDAQISKIHWRRPKRPTGKIGTYLELIDASTKLLQKLVFNNDRKRKFIMKRLVEMDKSLSKLLRLVIVEL